jgi:hypothetical protein
MHARRDAPSSPKMQYTKGASSVPKAAVWGEERVGRARCKQG